MKQKVLYTCEYCHTDYKLKTDAEKCEKIHRQKLKILDKRYLSYKQDASGFPVSITIMNEDGRTKVYKS